MSIQIQTINVDIFKIYFQAGNQLQASKNIPNCPNNIPTAFTKQYCVVKPSKAIRKRILFDKIDHLCFFIKESLLITSNLAQDVQSRSKTVYNYTYAENLSYHHR